MLRFLADRTQRRSIGAHARASDIYPDDRTRPRIPCVRGQRRIRRSIDRSISDGDTDNAQEKKRRKERGTAGGRFIYTAGARRLYSGHRSARPLPRRVKPPQIVPLYASNVFHPIPRSIGDSRRVSISTPRLCAYLLSRLRPSWYSTGSSRRASVASVAA